MSGVNKVIIIGNLGNDPDHKKFDNGGSLTNISIATSERWTDKQTGEQKELTEWHRVVLSNRLGEVAAQYLRKGSKVYIEGSLRTRKWQDANGVDKYTTEIRANNMQMLDGRAGDTGGGMPNQGMQNNSGFQNQGMQNQGMQNQGMQNNYQQPQQMQQQPSPVQQPVSTHVADDDLPF